MGKDEDNKKMTDEIKIRINELLKQIADFNNNSNGNCFILFVSETQDKNVKYLHVNKWMNYNNIIAVLEISKSECIDACKENRSGFVYK